MSKENNVLKTLVKYRTCGTCKWWMRNIQGVPVREHRCVWNHKGSARAMEMWSWPTSNQRNDPTRYTCRNYWGWCWYNFFGLITKEYGIECGKKKLDKSHCIKNNVKKLFDLRNKKEVNITNQVIQHLHKCINYIFSKNIGDVDGMRGELWEIQSPKLAIQNPTQWRVPSRKIECAVCTNYRKVGFVYWPRLVLLCSMPKNTCNLERAKAFIFRIQATATTYTVTWK